MIIFVVRATAFKDLSTEANEAAEGFSGEGMLGSFIYQYGQDLFRPDGNVTREDLLLVLGEYHILTKKLLSQNRQILDELNKLKSQKSQRPRQSQKSQNLSQRNMELILREFQKTLEPMLRNSETIVELKRQVGMPAAAASADLQDKFENVDKKGILMLKADMEKIENKITALNRTVYAQRKYLSEMAKEKTASSSEINRLQDEFDSINEKFAKLEKSYKSKGEVMPGNDRMDTVIPKKELNMIKKDLKDLKANISAQAKEKTASSSEINRLLDECKIVNKKVENLVKLYSDDERTDISNELAEISDEILVLNRTIDTQQKYIYREETFESSGGDMIPFWVKISMGFATIALLFMAR